MVKAARLYLEQFRVEWMKKKDRGSRVSKGAITFAFCAHSDARTSASDFQT
ncbi:MAG: hypothetical protein H0X49_05680 [Acidobacteria bacterium]|nr:hypothetical protein [Acidobacteriota bacterium]